MEIVSYETKPIKQKTPEQLLKLLDSVKVSDLPINEKARLIEDIGIKISGRKYTNEQVLRDIEDSQADYSDIKQPPTRWLNRNNIKLIS